VKFGDHWNESVLEVRGGKRLAGFITLPSEGF